MIIRVSFMVVASVAALKISQTINSSTKRNGTIKSPGSNGSHLEEEFEERENSTANANQVIQLQNEEEKQINIEMPQNMVKAEFKDFELLIGGEKMDSVAEKKILLNLVQNYKQREVNIERKLVQLNGLREEQLTIAQTQMQLEKKKTAKLYSLKKTIALLQSESKIIGEKIREDLLYKRQLDIAKRMISEMQRKKHVNGNPVRGQILMLQQQVTELQKHNSSGRNAMVNKKLKDAQDIELEVLELKRRNKELELEKRDMRIKLATAQARIGTEEEREARIKEEITDLRQVHEELSDQVERLQRNRFDMVQELVYQRWLYTLLRFEVNDHQKQSGNASRRDCSHISTKQMHSKTQAIKSDPELESVSSNATLYESDEIETTTFEGSSSSQSSSSNNSNMLSKMKRWRETKDYSKKISSKVRNFPNRPGLRRRFSMFVTTAKENFNVCCPDPLDLGNNTMVASDVSKSSSNSGNSSSKSLENPILPKMKRVSFSDSVKLSTYQDMPEAEAVENAIRDKETSVVKWDKHKAEKYEELRNSNEYVVANSVNIDSIAENEGAKNKIGHSDELCSRNETVCRKDQMVKTMLVAFLFFSLILLAYFRIR